MKLINDITNEQSVRYCRSSVDLRPNSGKVIGTKWENTLWETILGYVSHRSSKDA